MEIMLGQLPIYDVVVGLLEWATMSASAGSQQASTAKLLSQEGKSQAQIIQSEVAAKQQELATQQQKIESQGQVQIVQNIALQKITIVGIATLAIVVIIGIGLYYFIISSE